MRILITAFPGEGHVQPMLPLARAAQRRGHDVVVATGPDAVPGLRRRGFTAWAVGPTMAESFSYPHGLGPPPAGEPIFVTAGTRVFTPAAERLAAELLPQAQDWGPELVVSETTEVAGLVVAARTGARFVAHGLGPLPEPAHWLDVAAFAALCTRWGLPEPAGGLLDATYLDICPPSLHLRGHADGQDVRPMRAAAGDSAEAPAPVEGLAALPHRETVHLSLGTVVNSRPGAFDAALAGLCALPVNVVVTTGKDVDPATLGPQPPQVLVERYLPHATLLQHCAAMVSHAGAATMLAGYRHGLPQLFLPRGGAGAALVLAPDEADPAAVTAAAGRLLGEPGYTTAARRIRAEIEAMPDADTVFEALCDELERRPPGTARDG